jgi:glycosyltransferase involved in cell wall biosynthesis
MNQERGIIKMIRTNKDKIISLARKIYYRLYEPTKLFFVRRQKSRNEYKNLVTIIIPTYNRGELLMKRAIKSVKSQTYKFWECIVVGDGCTDNTLPLMLNELDKDDRFRFFNLERKEPAHDYNTEKQWYIGGLHARNFALENEVKGEYIAVLDDDDTWHPEFLDICIRTMEGFEKINKKCEFLSSSCNKIRRGVRILHLGNYAQSHFYTQKAKTPKGYNPKIGAHSSYFYRAYLKFFKYNKDCWRKKWNRVNDIDISYRMFKAGVKMGFIERALVNIFPRPNEETIGLEAVLEKMGNVKKKSLDEINAKLIKKVKFLDKILQDKGYIEFNNEEVKE